MNIATLRERIMCFACMQLRSTVTEKEVAHFKWSYYRNKDRKPFCVDSSLLEEIFSAVIIPLLCGVTETACVIKALLSLRPIGSTEPQAKSIKLLSGSETREMASPMGAEIPPQRHPFTSQTLSQWVPAVRAGLKKNHTFSPYN